MSITIRRSGIPGPGSDVLQPLADAAEGFRDQAEGFADGAAQSAAYAGGFETPEYASQSAGNAATTPGQIFRVPLGTSPQTFSWYRRLSSGSELVSPLLAQAAYEAKLALRADGSAGGGITFLNMGAPALLIDNPERSAEYFGVSRWVNSTAAFANINEWLKTRSRYDRRVIKFGPGVFYADRIHLEAPEDGLWGNVTIEGVGHNSTEFRPNDTDEKCFMSVEAGFIQQATFKGFMLNGIGLTNPDQTPFGLFTKHQPGIFGGASNVHIEGFRTYNFDGPFWIRGSQLVGGVGQGNLDPMQFMTFDRAFFQNNLNTGKPVFLSLGQFGQINFRNGFGDGSDRVTHLGARNVISKDYRIQRIMPSSVNTATDVFTAPALYIPSMTAVRVIGTNLPAPLTHGTTYLIHKSGYDLATPNDIEFKLATSVANAAVGSFVDITTTGTAGNYQFVQLWAVDIVSNTFVFDRCHMLCDGDVVRLYGSSLPTGTALATDYYVIRVDHTRFKLATSHANAIAGTAINISGGTPAQYGFAIWTGDIAQWGNLGQPYSVKMDCFTAQQTETGLFFGGVDDLTLDLHLESCQRGVEFVGGCNGAVRDGYYLEMYAPSGNGTVFLPASGSIITCEGVQCFNQGLDRIARRISSGQFRPGAARPFFVGGAAFATDAAEAYRSCGSTQQLTVGGDGTLNTGYATEVFVNPSATEITRIVSRLPPGSLLTIRVHVAAANETCTFFANNSSTGINLAGVQRVTAGRNAVLQFRLFDFGSAWTLNNSEGDVFAFQNIGWTANAITPEISAGDMRTGALTANSTVNAPTYGTSTPPRGHRWKISLRQNATGGFSVTWNAAWKGVTLTGPGTANQVAEVTFEWTEVGPVQVHSTGWIS